jgi:hypothetical protein
MISFFQVTAKVQKLRKSPGGEKRVIVKNCTFVAGVTEKKNAHE